MLVVSLGTGRPLHLLTLYFLTHEVGLVTLTPNMGVIKGENGYLKIIVDMRENIIYIYYAFHSLCTIFYISYKFSYACYKRQDFQQIDSRLTSGRKFYRK